MINTPGNNIVVVDSDALIGLIHETDELHEDCLKISQYLSFNSYGAIIPYPIVLEAATTLAKDKTIRRPDLALQLLEDYASIEEEPTVDLEVAELVAKLYDPKTSKKNTPFDHYILALARKNNIKHVFSFDEFYKKKGLTLMRDVVG